MKIRVLRMVCIELIVPEHVNPERAARQAMKAWPNRKGLKDRGITVSRVEDGIEISEPEAVA
ncbi:MAG TPA: hypothetical protein VGD46_13420 [Rhizobacter sp.]